MIDPREDLKAYLDGELSPERAAQMREAIEADPDLAREADEMRAIAATLRAEAAPDVVGLEQTLAALRGRRKSPAWWRTPAAGWVFALGGVACVAVVGTRLAPHLPERRFTMSEAAFRSETVAAAAPVVAEAAKIAPTALDADGQRGRSPSPGALLQVRQVTVASPAEAERRVAWVLETPGVKLVERNEPASDGRGTYLFEIPTERLRIVEARVQGAPVPSTPLGTFAAKEPLREPQTRINADLQASAGKERPQAQTKADQLRSRWEEIGSLPGASFLRVIFHIDRSAPGKGTTVGGSAR